MLLSTSQYSFPLPTEEWGEGESQFSTTIGVRSWNQLWACTKPLTLGESARGLRSCTTNSMIASRLAISCTLLKVMSRTSSSKLRIASATRSSTSWLKYQPQLPPPGDHCCLTTKRSRPFTGSCVARLMLMALYCGYFSRPLMASSSSAFQSITSSLTLKPTASSCAFTSSFIGKGCIWPEPEVEMASVTLQG